MKPYNAESNQSPAEMSTWQLFPDDGNTFRWLSSSAQLLIESKTPPIEQPSSPRRLPSISDLFLQGVSKLTEIQNDRIETPPTFRTGLGKSVSVKQSSLAKTFSILGDEVDDVAYTGQLSEKNNGSFPNSMFQTGSGKAVNISSSGLVKAKSLLGLGENDNAGGFKGFSHSKNQCNTIESFHQDSSSYLQIRNSGSNIGCEDATSVPVSPFKINSGLLEAESKEVTLGGVHSDPIPPPIKFHTAGGKSISVSGDALKRARSLLGDPELGILFDDGDAGEPVFPVTSGISSNHNSLKKKTGSDAYFLHDAAKVKETKKNFVSPIRTSYDNKCAVRLENVGTASNLIKKFDAEENESTSKLYSDMPCARKPFKRDSLENDSGSRFNSARRSSGGPLVDISNTMGEVSDDQQSLVEKRKPTTRISVSPFKRPRTTKFVTPLNKNSLITNGLPSASPQESYCKKTISTHYHCKAPRKYMKEYFGVPPCSQNMLENLSDCVRRMNPENAAKHVFCHRPSLDFVGVDTFSHMLVQSGSLPQLISKEWIANHYKWIVWKLACYERSYPARFSGKFLTVFNVLEELNYRYDREVNHSHRSALKKILEGDAPPSSMMVLCISSIHPACVEIESLHTSSGPDKSKSTVVELTDGWYSVNAVLDKFLSMKLATGKLFVGQKLRICGARLCDWVGPVSPLEASKTIILCLHINGTYRAHWADRLGFCKTGFVPLAFRCIMGGGGAVPCTLVGVTRIYPVLYRERLPNGGHAVRSERTETKMMQLYDQRRSSLAEGIMSDFQRGTKTFQTYNDQTTIDECEKLFKKLETAAEPEIIMAGMSSKQLASFASYQAKQEAMMQSDMQKSIEKALKDAGLNGRDVTLFMRVRVVGLTSKSNVQKCCLREGLITIWNPTEKQQSELVEGQTYAITGLVPLTSDSNTVYLQARGSTNKWRPLSPSATQHFLPFFNPRKPVFLSKMDEVPLSSEFDIAAFVIHVGEVYKTSHQKMQWVFVADGDNTEFNPEDSSSQLLAISFCSPSLDSDSITPINHNLTGSTVGFCNLIKRKKDTANNVWVAEAIDNSTYFLSYDKVNSCHLKDAAMASHKWARASSSTIAKLKKKVFSVILNKPDGQRSR